MKQCPTCSLIYADASLNFCLEDGSRLVDAANGEAPTIALRTSDAAVNARSSEPLKPDIQYCTTADGIGIAYSVIGSGPMLVRVLGHFTHLEKEWEYPDLRLLWQSLADSFTVVRYDGRGIGLSESFDGEFTEESRLQDLEAVLEAVGAEDATLFGISEGGWTAASYTVNKGHRADRLILYGSYSRGASARDGYDPEEDQAILTLIRKGWGRDTPAFRQLFTSTFFRPDADPKLIDHFNDLQRASATPEIAAKYWESVHARGDGSDMFRQITLPTLVIHCQDDIAVSADEGRRLAAIIPGAHLVLLPSGSHYFPTDSEVVDGLVQAIDNFMSR